MTYPLPGETVVATRRHVEFGRARPRDEPAPPELAALFLAWRTAEEDEDQAYLAHDAARYSRRSFRAWLLSQTRAGKAYQALALALKRHRQRCFTLNHCRFWWHVEPERCRRESVKWENLE